ncbi:hypothetical protein WR25_09838 [Diploscapter pachys]|uniref:FAT domain-containing protein n=1 Tax=Diploscapter pachys TaxID=2018661 RepID=A0A2A2KUC3_9BILA|nr:hypothetical protein WR25_09838 [Diploscapter pachys]
MASTSSFPNQPNQSTVSNQIANLIRNLSDFSHRDDFKLKALQEIWSTIDVYNSTTVYSPQWENLIRCFLKIFFETSPQFISENNTQQLRKLMLEIILRTSTNEALKNLTKEIQKAMLRLLTIENEENAILTIKILLDQGKASRFQFSQEVSNVYAHFKKVIRDICTLVCNTRMFELKELRPSAQPKEEMLIEEYLRDCFYSMSVYLNPNSEAKYNLIPRASQSVKVIQEFPNLVILFYQHFKQNVQQETSDFLQSCLQYLSLQIPPETINSPNLNKNLVDEFYVSQAKVLNFVNQVGKIPVFLEVILANGQLLVSSVMLLLENCPPDAITVRKDVLMTLKFFFTSDLRSKFIAVLPRLVSETHLLGTGFTSVDQLRSSMYHILADLLHHMRNQFTFPMLSHVAFVFCRQLHDNTVTIQVQIMSARLLNSITETMTKMEDQGEPSRDLLFQILECLVTKLKVLAVYHVPLLLQQHAEEANGDSNSKDEKQEKSEKPDRPEKVEKTERSEKSNVGVWHGRLRRVSIDSLDELEMPKADDIASDAPPTTNSSSDLSTPQAIMSAYWAIPGPPLFHVDVKNLVKYVLHTCKCAASQLRNTKTSNESIPMARERDIFERLLKYGIECLEVFTISSQNNFMRNNMAQQAQQVTRSKEEKESLEALSAIFTNMDQDVFREVFSKYMDYLIERIFRNVPLQLLVNTFLVRGEVSCFGGIILKYLMGKLPALTANNERTGLYVKLFKIIFSAIGAIGAQANEAGELMLKPYLPDMIRKSTEFALTANDPLNYFLLLRALFRSIGGGAHDILYGQFLPLLPNLHFFLNKLQSCQHVVQMRELFVELCLTVPVRLSSLLPYLPLLMDPLVCALHGSTSLVQQGLRTLELCVDNLQPEYLFEHLAPVRGALMQGLWKVVGSSMEGNSAATAFRILGKFGGANRRMLNEPQQLNMVSEAESVQSFVTMRVERQGAIQMEGETAEGAPAAKPAFAHLNLALSDIVKNALEYIRSTTPPNDQINAHFPFPQNNHPVIQQNAQQIRLACLELANAVLLAGLKSADFEGDIKINISQPLKLRLQNINLLENITIYKCPREADRTLYINSLAIIIFGMYKKDLRQGLKFFNAIVRTLCVQSILECSVEWQSRVTVDPSLCMDSAILIDALMLVLSDMNNRLTHSAVTVIRLIRDTFQLIFPPQTMPQIPLCRYMLDNLFTLCHGPAWFVRLGGAGGFLYVSDMFPAEFLAVYQKMIVKGCIEVIIGLVDEISSGAIDTAVDALSRLQKRLLTKDGDCEEYLNVFVHNYAQNFFHTCSNARHLMASLLKDCAELLDITLQDLIHKYRHIFFEGIEMALANLERQRIYDQEANLDALSVLLSSPSPIFHLSIVDPKLQQFLHHMVYICREDVSQLLLRENYKCTDNCPAHFLPPHPMSTQIESLKAIAIKTCVVFGHCLSLCERADSNVQLEGQEDRNRLVNSRILYETALEAMLYGKPVVNESASQGLIQWKESISPQIIQAFADPICNRILASDCFLPDDAIRLHKLSEINQSVLTRDIIYKLAMHLCSWTSNNIPEGMTVSNQVAAISVTIKLLSASHHTTAFEAKGVAFFVAAFDYEYLMDEAVGWYDDLFSLCCRFPRELLTAFVSIDSIQSQPRRALLRKLLRHEASELIRNLILTDFSFVENLLDLRAMNDHGEWTETEQSELETMERELLALTVVDVVSRLCPQWLISPSSPVSKLREIWNSGDFKKRCVVRSPTEEDAKQVRVQMMTEHKYKAPKLIVNCFIRYLRQNTDDFELLFDLMIAFIGNYVTDFCFVREFLEKEIIPKRSISWRREAFLKIMEKFETNPDKTCNDLRTVKVIQYLLMPCLQWAFERYDVDEIIGSTAHSAEQNEAEHDSLVHRLVCVVDLHRQKMSDSMIIVFYQLCTLFVKYSPHHIHNNSSKKQGGRLRIFMLFAWPCLTQNNHQDPTLRSTGFNFLAHIIEKFTINRKIVLQVFHALCTTYQLDNREMIRRAADLLTPAVPMRMEDGYQQIFASVNKVLIEEGHNSFHVHHVLQMILRNYRVYFSVRHALLPVLLTTLNKAINFPSGMNEGISSRRLAVDCCEMALKWDLLRKIRQERAEPEDMETDKESEVAKKIWKEEEMKVEKILEKLKVSENTMEDPMAVLDQANGSAAKERPLEDIRAKAISKEHIDEIVNTLFRFAVLAVSSSQQPNSVVQSILEAKNRCIQLLRVALKATMWGGIVTIRVNFLEKQLTVTQEMVNAAAQHNSTACLQAQQALELLLFLFEVMPKQLLLDIVRPLQRVIITCLNTNVSTLARGVIALVSRLFDKTDYSEAGITEVEQLNSYITLKYIHEQLTTFYKMPGGSAQQIALPILMLKTICTKEPAYVERNILHVFLRVTEKITKDHVAVCGPAFDMTREKGNIEVIVTAYDLLRHKVPSLVQDVRRAVASSVLSIMMDKTPSEKIIDAILKIIKELIVHHTEENPPTPGIHLLVRMQSVIDRRFKNNKDLTMSLLTTALIVFENDTLREHENVDRLEPAFHWGLIHSDAELRDRFLLAYERRLPVDVVDRFIFLMQKTNWLSFGEYYWLRHAIWFLLRCVPRDNARRSAFLHCASLQPTLLASYQPLSTSVESQQPQQQSEDLDKLVEEMDGLVKDAEFNDFSAKLSSIYYLMFTVNETSFVVPIWCELFTSLWNWMSDAERDQVHRLIDPFLSSGVHNAQTRAERSVLTAWLRALTNAIPHIILSPHLLKHLASNHHAWHSGLLLLETQALTSPRMIDLAPQIEANQIDPHTKHNINVLDNLAAAYEELGETDQLAAAWGRRALLPNTERIIQWVQMGEIEAVVDFIEQTSGENYEKMVATAEEERHVRDAVDAEYDMWMETYKKCCMELQRWTTVRDVCANNCVQDLRGLIQIAPHLPDWNLAADCIEQLGACVPRGFLPQFSLYNAMNCVMRDDENPGTSFHKQKLEKAIEETQAIHISRWRALPSVISNSHVKILQSMNIIRDIADCVDLRVALANSQSGTMFNNQVLQDMKTVIKIWRNRTPAMSDEVSFVSTVSNWRCQIHTMVIQMFQQWELSGCQVPNATASSPMILPIHSAATGTLAIARACKNMGFNELAIHNLNRMHAMPMLPLMDAHQKICENVKVLRAIARDERMQSHEKKRALYEALEIIENVKIDELHRDQICRLMYQKGAALSELGINSEASKAFSAAAQVHDSTSYSGSNSCNVYKVWGQHLHKLFVDQLPLQPHSASVNGMGAMMCYLEASRVDCESKARKCILKFFLIMRNLCEIGDENEVDVLLNKHARSIAPYNWLHWLPQLLLDLRIRPRSGASAVLHRIASVYPMQTLYALRGSVGDQVFAELFEACIRAEEQNQPVFDHPLQFIIRTTLSTRQADAKTFYRLISEMREMKEYWVEKHIRYADECIREVTRTLHEERNRDGCRLDAVQGTALSPRMIALLNEWKLQLDNTSDPTLIKEHQVELSASDSPQPMSEDEFISSIRNSIHSIDLPSTPLFNLLEVLLSTYQQILNRFVLLPKKIPIDLSSEYLEKYNYRMGCVEMPSDLLNVLKTGQYNSLFGRFGRFVQIEMDGSVLVKRIEIRAQTGKSCTFHYRKRLILSGERRNDMSREVQFLQHMNTLLLRDRATSRRHLSVCAITQLHVSDNGTLMEIGSMSLFVAKGHEQNFSFLEERPV